MRVRELRRGERPIIADLRAEFSRPFLVPLIDVSASVRRKGGRLE